MSTPDHPKPSLPLDYAAVLAQRGEGLRQQLSRILATESDFVWEVGSGHGHFLTAYAAAHPERTCIGVDLVSERIERALRKRDRTGLKNLHFLRADARLFLDCLPTQVAISHLFVLFPDPWPKARHHKHRILQPDFLAAAAAVATAECRLHFRTDFRPYFEAARATVGESPHWQLLDSATPWPFEFTTVFQARAPEHASLIARKRPG